MSLPEVALVLLSFGIFILPIVMIDFNIAFSLVIKKQ